MSSAIINAKKEDIANALINIGRILIVLAIMLVGSLFFTKDLNEFVLFPIEDMIEKVEKISKNPLAVAQMKIQEKTKRKIFETRIIANSIIKLAKILLLGFGEAGSSIIAKNIG